MLLKSLILVLQGAIVGTGAILPGVSGGVLLVAFGIYEPMMALLSHPRKFFEKYYKMFIPFLIGGLLGFTLLARVVEAMFNASAPVALMLFVGIPLPGTGAWTGTLAASFLNMGIKSTSLAVSCGVVIAGLIMGLASTGVLSIFGL